MIGFPVDDALPVPGSSPVVTGASEAVCLVITSGELLFTDDFGFAFPQLLAVSRRAIADDSMIAFMIVCFRVYE